MDLEKANQVLEKYKGGQLEVNNGLLGLFCGEIESAQITLGESDTLLLIVQFRWLANKNDQGEWCSQLPGEGLLYRINLSYSLMLSFSSATVHYLFFRAELREEGTLYPPRGERLDPKLVQGLVHS